MQYLAGITAGIKPLSSVLDLVSGTALLPARQGRHHAGQCTGGCLSPYRGKLEHSAKKADYVCHFQGYSRALGYLILPFLPFSLPIIVSWHSQGDSQPRYRLMQRCPDSEGAAWVTWLPIPRENQARNPRSAKPAADWFPVFQGKCSTTFRLTPRSFIDVFLSQFLYHWGKLKKKKIPKKPVNNPNLHVCVGLRRVGFVSQLQYCLACFSCPFAHQPE